MKLDGSCHPPSKPWATRPGSRSIALVRAGGGGLAVGRLQDKLKIAPSTLSHHIKALVSAGLVNQVREATTLVCHANYDVMRGLVDFLVAEMLRRRCRTVGTQKAPHSFFRTLNFDISSYMGEDHE